MGLERWNAVTHEPLSTGDALSTLLTLQGLLLATIGLFLATETAGVDNRPGLRRASGWMVRPLAGAVCAAGVGVVSAWWKVFDVALGASPAPASTIITAVTILVASVLVSVVGGIVVFKSG